MYDEEYKELRIKLNDLPKRVAKEKNKEIVQAVCDLHERYGPIVDRSYQQSWRFKRRLENIERRFKCCGENTDYKFPRTLEIENDERDRTSETSTTSNTGTLADMCKLMRGTSLSTDASASLSQIPQTKTHTMPDHTKCRDVSPNFHVTKENTSPQGNHFNPFASNPINSEDTAKSSANNPFLRSVPTKSRQNPLQRTDSPKFMWVDPVPKTRPNANSKVDSQVVLNIADRIMKDRQGRVDGGGINRKLDAATGSTKLRKHLTFCENGNASFKLSTTGGENEE
eukprot:CAMPEP_0115015628 /NCGR_PEP_ID=MMETSP0216-20121206/26891_1 /TAXON_ID=223996 /ORGANISM="Protocruzia adherens, Strain Boccale" /LENGTH=282 /DNA_ID=CAMNT_0002385803 /DNA_START=13 /DNA_END=861 /DNA_ORIENTATION=+